MLITPKLTPWPKFSFPREKKLRLRNYRVHAYELTDEICVLIDELQYTCIVHFVK